jgi:hypothetical protein
MTIVQHSHTIAEPASQWWEIVHDTAVQFERILTPDPETVAPEAWQGLIDTLQVMSRRLRCVPHTKSIHSAHQSLMQAIDYLWHCYVALSQAHVEEARFYYNNALLQVIHLHQFLVDNALST